MKIKNILKTIAHFLLAALLLPSCRKKEETNIVELILQLLVIQELTRPQACTILAAADTSADPVAAAMTYSNPEENTGSSATKVGYFETPDGLQKLSYQDFNGAYLVGGDMVYAELASPPAATDPNRPNVVAPKSTSKRWPNKQVNYTISGADSTMVQKAIAHWEANSEFRFTNSATGDYLSFVTGVSGGGCWSYVGRIGGAQQINVDSNCGVGSTVHEIGHALGMEHEQTRIDRDEYVIVYTDRITSGNEGNYAKNSSATHVDLGPYDFTSIMHYGSYYFASGSDPVMTKKDGSIITPNRTALTTCDVSGLKQLYADYSN